jgi:hypothetical protein
VSQVSVVEAACSLVQLKAGRCSQPQAYGQALDAAQFTPRRVQPAAVLACRLVSGGLFDFWPELVLKKRSMDSAETACRRETAVPWTGGGSGQPAAHIDIGVER